MDSRLMLESEKSRVINIDERMELIHELSKRPECALEMLQHWSRRQILEILCAVIGKERKYTGLSKQKMIEQLFRIISEQRSGEYRDGKDATHRVISIPHEPAKRQRKSDHPMRLPVAANVNAVSNVPDARNHTHYCANSACRAPISLEDPFCKRCSCCICYKFDDNKDPSLWLVCSSDALAEGASCGMSCHLLCAMNDERAGIFRSEQLARLDGSYHCINCGKVNDLLGCWRKQLIFAKDARRVDVLCQRVSLSHKLLSMSEKYQHLHQIVDIAMEKLEAEVGPLDDFSNMARGIVNRLSVGADVQKLCAQAVDLLDSMHFSNSPAAPAMSKSIFLPSNYVKFEDVSQTSVKLIIDSDSITLLHPDFLGYELQHKMADAVDYTILSTAFIPKLCGVYELTGLSPSTNYTFKVTVFSSTGELGKWEAQVATEAISKDDTKSSTNSSGQSNHIFVGDEANNPTKLGDLNQLPENCVDYSEKPEIVDLEKSSDKSSVGAEDAKHMKPAHSEDVKHVTSGNSASEEPNHMVRIDSLNSPENNQASDAPKSDNESNGHMEDQMMLMGHVFADSPHVDTPCILETRTEAAKMKTNSIGMENGVKEGLAGSSSKHRIIDSVTEENLPKECPAEEGFGYCVKIIRWLECEGHIELNFRMKFLTWLSLRATQQERRIVRVYMETMIDDPVCLAGQLVDTFSDAVFNKGPPAVPTSFCVRLWH